MNIQSLVISLLLGAADAQQAGMGLDGYVSETYRVSQLYPEGIAYDAANKRILLSSIISNSIMSFDPHNHLSHMTTYTPDSTNPSGLGLKVDRVTGQVYSTIDNFVNQDNGGLAVYELPVTPDAEADASIVSTADLPCTDGETKCGLANDVAVDGFGVAYVTDSAVGRLFKVENGDVELISDDIILQWTDEAFPFAVNGLVHVADLGILLVFNSQTQTLLRVDLESNEITEVTINGEINGGGDGMLLSSDGILYAVTGGTHITAFSTEDDWTSANVLGTLDVSHENESATTITFGETEDEIYVTHVRFGDLFGGTISEDPSLISKVVLRNFSSGYGLSSGSASADHGSADGYGDEGYGDGSANGGHSEASSIVSSRKSGKGLGSSGKSGKGSKSWVGKSGKGSDSWAGKSGKGSNSWAGKSGKESGSWAGSSGKSGKSSEGTWSGSSGKSGKSSGSGSSKSRTSRSRNNGHGWGSSGYRRNL